MKTALRLLLLAACGCGATARARPTAPSPPVAVNGPTSASLTVTLRADAVAYHLVATGGRACANDLLGETRCAAPDSPTDWQHSVDALSGMPLRDGYVVSSDRLTLRTDAGAFEQHIEPGAGVFTEVLGEDQAFAVTAAPLPEIAPGVRGRATREVIGAHAASLARTLGPARGTILVDAGPSVSTEWALVLEEGAELSDDQIRAWMTSAWTGARGWRRGVAQYQTWLIDVREGRRTRETFLSAWLAAYLTYRSSVDGRPLDDSNEARRLAGGAVIALCADAALRTNGSDLLGARGSLPASLAAEMETRAAFRGVMDIDPCLAPLGLRLAVARYEDPGADALLRVGAVADDPPTITVGRSFFEAGDRLVSVADVAVTKLEDVAWALREIEVGDRFIIVVERDGQTRRTWARRPRTSGDERTRYFLAATESSASISLE